MIAEHQKASTIERQTRTTVSKQFWIAWCEAAGSSFALRRGLSETNRASVGSLGMRKIAQRNGPIAADEQPELHPELWNVVDVPERIFPLSFRKLTVATFNGEIK